MFSRRSVLIFAGLLILVSLAACAPLPSASQAPAATTAQQAAPAQAAAPAATTAPAATATFVPSPTPAVPDPKTDSAAALLYAGNGKLFKTAEFTYTMTVNMAPADDASVKALGSQAEQLKGLTMGATGSGALEVTDPASLKSKMRMDMDISAAGQQMKMQMVQIDQTAWIKLSGQDAWQKVTGDQAKSVAPGISPEQMLQDFKDAVDIQWIEDVTQNGEQLSHLRFTLDPSKLDLGNLPTGTTGNTQLTPEEVQAMFKDSKPVVDVWLAKQTLELRGEKMKLEWVMPLPQQANAGNAKLRVAMTMDMQLKNVNQPVTIQPPAE